MRLLNGFGRSQLSPPADVRRRRHDRYELRGDRYYQSGARNEGEFAAQRVLVEKSNEEIERRAAREESQLAVFP